MRFMVIVRGGCSGEKPSEERLAEMGKYNDELKKAGVFLALEGLAKSGTPTCVKFDGKKRVVTDGPFAESKELIGGYWLWECKSKQEALEWLKRAPFDAHEVELREVIDQKDFADQFTRAYREQQSRSRETVGTR